MENNDFPIYEWLKQIYEKDDNILNNEVAIKNVYLINRFLSMNLPNIKLCNEINKCLFWVDKKIIIGYFYFTIQHQKVPYINYISKPKKKDDNDIFFFEKVKKYYGWSERELNYNKQFIINKLNEDPKFFVDLFGLNMREIEKMKINFKREKLVIKFQESLSHGLCDFR